jgi:hypothetical protein
MKVWPTEMCPVISSSRTLRSSREARPGRKRAERLGPRQIEPVVVGIVRKSRSMRQTSW